MNWYITSQQKPNVGFHITYLSNLDNILGQGLLVPKTSLLMRTNHLNDLIYLFRDIQDASKIANEISLNRDADWVLLKVNNLDPNFIFADDDWGEVYQESLENYGTFAYGKNIPPTDIEVVAKAEGTDEHRHDEFENISS